LRLIPLEPSRPVKLSFIFNRQFAVFVGVGVTCALIDLGAMRLMLAMGYGALPAATLGFALGFVANFVLHTRLTFASKFTTTTLVKFVCVVALNYLITLACVQVSVLWLGNPWPGKLISLVLVALNGFTLSKLWIYR
jgi:putative flippase GtrA